MRVILQSHVAVADELLYVASYDISLSQVLVVVFDRCHAIPHPFIASSQEEEGLGTALILGIIPQESLEGLFRQLIVPIQKVTFADEETSLSGFLLRSFVR